MKSDKIIRHLPEFLQEGQNLTDLTGAVAEELNIALSFLDGTKKEIQISTATGVYLDDIASLFNLTRNAEESDVVFRARILSFISQSVSSGTAEDIQNVVSNFTGLDPEEVLVEDIGPAKIKVTASVGSTFELANSIFDIISKTKAAGVYAFLDIEASTTDLIELVDTVDISVILSGRFYGLFVYGNQDSVY